MEHGSVMMGQSVGMVDGRAADRRDPGGAGVPGSRRARPARPARLRHGVLSVATARRLLTRLREMMASGAAPLADVVRLVAAEMAAEVCSIYALRPGDALELIATFGLRPDAVGRTRLRMGEGHRRVDRRDRRNPEPAGRADAPGLRLPAGDGGGAVRLDAGRAGAARWAHDGRGGGAEPLRRGATARTRWT